MKRKVIIGILAAVMGLGVAQAASESVYGERLMNEQERATYQNTVRNMATEQERSAYRAEHQAKMQARAREQGVTLNDEGVPVDADGKPLRDRDQDRDRLDVPDRDQTRDQDRLHDGTGTGSGVGSGMGGGGGAGGAGGGGR